MPRRPSAPSWFARSWPYTSRPTLPKRTTSAALSRQEETANAQKLQGTCAQIVLFGAVLMADQADIRLRADRRLRARLGGCLTPRSRHGNGRMDCMNIPALPSSVMPAHAAPGAFRGFSAVKRKLAQCLGMMNFPE